MRLVTELPLRMTAGPPAAPIVSDLLMISGDPRLMLPETENLIVSLLAALEMAWRSEPAPLSLLLMTDQTAISSLGSSASIRAGRAEGADGIRSTRPWRI
jgi:hypothetical protein